MPFEEIQGWIHISRYQSQVQVKRKDDIKRFQPFLRISNIDRDYCVGRSSSRGSQKGRSCGMNHSCMAVTHVKDMLLTCDDGSKRKYPVTFTTECKCQPTSNQASRYPFLTWIWLITMIHNHSASTWVMLMTHEPISSFNFHLSWNILVQNKTWLYHINYIPYHYLVIFDHFWSFYYCEPPMSETQNKSETKVWPLLNNFLQVAFNKTDISTCIKLCSLAKTLPMSW